MTKCICVWYWFIFLPYVSPFLKKKSWSTISIDVSTKHHVIKAERAQRCNRIPSDITLGRNYPSAGYLDANLVLPKWYLIHDFNCVTREIQQNNRKRKQEQFWIILWRSLELLNRNKSQKTIPVLWQYNCLHWVLTVESSSLKLSIYMSQVMSCLFIIHID